MDETCFSQGKGHLHLWPVIALMFHSAGTEPVTDINNHTKAVNWGIPKLKKKKKKKLERHLIRWDRFPIKWIHTVWAVTNVK